MLAHFGSESRVIESSLMKNLTILFIENNFLKNNFVNLRKYAPEKLFRQFESLNCELGLNSYALFFYFMILSYIYICGSRMGIRIRIHNTD